MLDALIRSGDEIVGVVCHEHVGPVREWTLDEQSFAGSMADLAALSLEVHQRHEAERALQAAQAELEARVVRRTEALSAANTVLASKRSSWPKRKTAPRLPTGSSRPFSPPCRTSCARR